MNKKYTLGILIFFVLLGTVGLYYRNNIRLSFLKHFRSVEGLGQAQDLNKPISNDNVDPNDVIAIQLNSVKADYALIFPSQGLDEQPLWSNDGQYVYTNEEGTWKKITLSKVKLQSGTWFGELSVGINQAKDSISVVENKDIEIIPLYKNSKFSLNDITISNGTRIQFKHDLFSTSMLVTKPNEPSKVLWDTDLEECYDLVVSPNEKYILFKCVTNGLLLMKAP